MYSLLNDHPSMRVGLAALINHQSKIQVVAEAANGEEAIEVYSKTKPDVVLMDLRMPGIGGVEAILAIRKVDPDVKVIVLSTYDLDEDIHLAIRSGAASYLLKDTPIEDIANAITSAYAGNVSLPKSVTKRLAESLQREQLTEREKEVLEALIMGRSNKEIASRLSISDETAKSHLKTLFQKLNVCDRTEAAIAAVRHGIVHLD
ncbi:response regulator transcription factor [Pelagicoccus sp. SDUM812002]|uniref:response regulator transcription factor n=1 Tax=Pelagicoccus sp. SDUM812002 TaxID=3041266 RepID=UPI00280D8D28|nr:response regulator transcription factor [Pelagicoccus sp. SDUM812002]MDQ8184215.1 response regulator transcription factor [Pelagicoccus sp. SDUM812002]